MIEPVPRAFTSVMLVTALVLASCRSARAPAPLRPPAVDVLTRHFAGTLLTGPTPGSVDPASISPQSAYHARCRLIYVQNLPTAALEPLGAHSMLVLDSRSADPLLGYSPAGERAQIGSGQTARHFLEELDGGPLRSVELGALDGIATPGLTAVFEARSVDTIVDPVDGPTLASLVILISRPRAGEAAQVALLLQRFAVGAETATTPALTSLLRQLVLLEEPLDLSGEPLVIAVPSPFEGDEANGFVFGLWLEPPSEDASHVARVEEVASDLVESTAEAARLAEAIEVGSPDLRAMHRGLNALELARSQRPAMVFIAATGDGAFALDVALSAEDLLLAEWIRRLQEDLESAVIEDESTGKAELNWRFERSAWIATLERAKTRQLAPALRGLLLRHAGAAARYPALLMDSVMDSVDDADLDARITSLNRSALFDKDTAKRTRAHDWLTDRGLAIPEFDPFASRADRRAALKRANVVDTWPGAGR